MGVCVCVCVASCVRVCTYMCVSAGLCIGLCVCVAKSLPQGFRPYTQRTSVKYTVFRRVYMLAVYYIINIMHIKGGQMLQIFFFSNRVGAPSSKGIRDVHAGRGKRETCRQ